MSTEPLEPDAAGHESNTENDAPANARASSQATAVKTADEDEPRPICGLDGCQEPLPARPRDELGRPKGGRRARYCSKAHADAASRQRRASDLAAVADPLALAREATAGVLPVAKQLSEQLIALVARFEQAENGALARVRAAETEAEQAHAEAARAAEAEQQAEQARREALAAARKDREEKDQARRRAEQAQAETEQVRDDAWKQVAEHERARGQAEAELSAVRAGREQLRREHAELLDTAQDQRTRITRIDLELATTGVELRQAGDRVSDLTARLEHSEQREAQARQAAERHQAELNQAQAEIARLRSRLEANVNPPVTRSPKPARKRPRVAGNRTPEKQRPQS